MKRGKIHLQAEAPYGREALTYCGRTVWAARTTPLPAYATCETCREAYEWGEPANPSSVAMLDRNDELLRQTIFGKPA